MFGWHHWLNAHEFEQTLGDGGGQGSLVCCSPWGLKESDTTEQPNNNNSMDDFIYKHCVWNVVQPIISKMFIDFTFRSRNSHWRSHLGQDRAVLSMM